MREFQIAFILAGIILIILSWLYIRHCKKQIKRKIRSLDYKMSFKESLDLAELPVVTFYQGKNKINFILDTGSNLSIIDKTVADKLRIEPNELNVNLIGIDGNPQDAPTGLMKIAYKDIQFEDVFQIIDMSKSFKAIKDSTGVSIHGVLGNAFFQKYQYVIDFEEMIAYSKKKHK